MRGYEYDREELRQDMEDGYDDYEDEDEYEQDEYEEEEEEEEEEDPRPTKEALDYLELRQRLKEQIRRKNNKKATGSGLKSSNDRKRTLPYDNYGSFFGPSQPVISQRVIEESKSLLETQHLMPKVSNPSQLNKRSASSSASGSKPRVQDKKPRVVNEVRNKVQKLKQARDYSFLTSDDAEPPAPQKVAPQRNMHVPSSESRPAQVPLKSKLGSVNNGRHVNGSYGERKPVPTTNGHRNSRTEPSKIPSTNRPSSTSMDSRRPNSSTNGTGPGRPGGPKGVPPKTPSSMERRAPLALEGRNSLSNSQKPITSRSQPLSRSQLPPSRSQSSLRAPLPSSKPQPHSRSQPTSRSQPPSRSQPSSKSQPTVSRQQMDQRRGLQEPTKTKMIPKPSAGLSRPPPQINKQPLKRVSSHQRSPDNRPKKKPMRRYSDEDDDEGEAALRMIRKLTGYNPNKFADRDDDLSDMEANYEDIMREERRSAKIGRKEDEEQLRLIEEEERRERLKKQRRR